jgi:hypothetical protein
MTKGTKGSHPLFRLLRWSLGAAAVIVVLAVLAGSLALRASLPQLDGDSALAGLEAAVSIERDELGVPVIRGTTRAGRFVALRSEGQCYLLNKRRIARVVEVKP